MMSYELRRLQSIKKIKVLCIGTNEGPGAKPLNWAHKDATDVAHVFAGRLGPVDVATYLISPTVAEVRKELKKLELSRPDVLILFVSGHGSEQGILLADGTLGYKELARWIAAIGAEHTLTALDVCHAGEFLRKHAGLGEAVGAVDVTYLALLAQATASSRVICSVGANRFSHEGGAVQNGHATAAFLEAVARARGNLLGWITDEELFSTLEAISVDKYGQQPIALGLTGDFPVLRAQRGPLGAATIIQAAPAVSTFDVSVLVLNRHGVPTAICGELARRSGRVLAAYEQIFVPEDDTHLASARFAVPNDVLAADPYCRLGVVVRGEVELPWRVEVRDLRGRVLAQTTVNVRWGRLRAA